MIKNNEYVENVLLVGVALNIDLEKEKIFHSLDELEDLTKTAGGIVKAKLHQFRDKIDAKYYIGKGKLEQIKFECQKHNISLVIFDEELSPSQQRNLEEYLKVRVIDRTALIIDIFAMHAATNEAKLQIELAKYMYDLPRLRSKYTMFSQQVGMIGTRGPGEKQLELDKRKIRDRISVLKDKLKYVEQQRFVQRKERMEAPNIVLVGYTNAGKSSLLNRLTNAETYVADQLFATLDPLARKYILPNNQKVIFIDTVGFIKKLPHQLVEAFKTTLDVVRYADILLHIVDVSDDFFEDNIKAVYQTFNELKIRNIPIITFFNKIDKIEKINVLKIHKNRNIYPNVIEGSAKTGANIELLINKIIEILNVNTEIFEVVVPIEKYKIITNFIGKLQIDKLEYIDDKIDLIVKGKKEYIVHLKNQLGF
ncbi:MAG TPA: GTPase HflX [bacterium]|nr:GTPase HflX [bacterium]